MTGTSGYEPCGRWLEERNDRCWARGQKRYGGRCADHKTVITRQCGSLDTSSGEPCGNEVGREGDRCFWHSDSGKRDQITRRRAELKDKIRRALTQRDAIDAKLAGWKKELRESES